MLTSSAFACASYQYVMVNITTKFEGCLTIFSSVTVHFVTELSTHATGLRTFTYDGRILLFLNDNNNMHFVIFNNKQ